MKCLRRFCFASVLTFALTISTFAGDIHTGAVPPPPPPDPQTASTGEIYCGVIETNENSISETASVDPMTELTLNILQSVMALF
jgi:hypothetical protein